MLKKYTTDDNRKQVVKRSNTVSFCYHCALRLLNDTVSTARVSQHRSERKVVIKAN